MEGVTATQKVDGCSRKVSRPLGKFRKLAECLQAAQNVDGS